MTGMTRLERNAGDDGVIPWLRSMGFVPEREMWCIAWSGRLGYDFTSLEFWPHDKGWAAIVGHHASGENPRMGIGDCESLEDVQRTYEAIRLINGYKEPEPNRGPVMEHA